MFGMLARVAMFPFVDNMLALHYTAAWCNDSTVHNSIAIFEHLLQIYQEVATVPDDGCRMPLDACRHRGESASLRPWGVVARQRSCRRGSLSPSGRRYEKLFSGPRGRSEELRASEHLLFLHDFFTFTERLGTTSITQKRKVTRLSSPIVVPYARSTPFPGEASRRHHDIMVNVSEALTVQKVSGT